MADKRKNVKTRRALFEASGTYKKNNISNGPDKNYRLAQPLDDLLPYVELKKKNGFH